MGSKIDEHNIVRKKLDVCACTTTDSLTYPDSRFIFLYYLMIFIYFYFIIISVVKEYSYTQLFWMVW